MPAPFIELTLLVVMCALLCLIVVAIVCGERQQLRRAYIAERVRSVSGGPPSTDERVKKGHTRNHSTSIHGPHIPCEELCQAGFTPTQIDRLLLYRAAYRGGWYQPDPLAPRRLAYAHWLFQHGKISG